MSKDLKRLCKSSLEPKSKCKDVGSLVEASRIANPYSIRRLKRVDVGKGCQTTIKSMFSLMLSPCICVSFARIYCV